MDEEKKVKLLDNFTQLSQIKSSVSQPWLDYVQKTLFSSLNGGEILLVLYKAKALGLDVLNGEVTAYAAEGKHGRQLVFIISKDAKARRAMQTGNVEYSSSEAIYIKTDDKGNTVKVQPWEGGKLWGATATIKRKDEIQPQVINVVLGEYAQDNTQWRSKPDTMIKKVALSQAITRAFPELFTGVYDEAEVDRGNLKDIGVNNNVPIDEPEHLDDDSIDKINAATSLGELANICKEIEKIKGFKYKQEIYNAYSLKRTQIEIDQQPRPEEEADK